MHEVVGFLAVGAATAALLHSWELPKALSGGVLILCLLGAALAGFEPTIRPDAPNEPASITAVPAMPPTEGRVAATRHLQPKAEAAMAW